ncbi:SMI1/KNR4 family protein [Planctopirus hydrillae]|nr:SMI1/KNR4 family protein [Planctopirus hydrillae]
MTVDELLRSMEHLVLHEGASVAAIAEIECHLGKSLPALYVELMIRSSGIEGFLGEAEYLTLWPLENLVELNEGYGVCHFAPGIWLFGSNGGGTGYGFDLRRDGMPVVEAPFIGLSLDEVVPRGNSFGEFLRSLQSG